MYTPFYHTPPRALPTSRCSRARKRRRERKSKKEREADIDISNHRRRPRTRWRLHVYAREASEDLRACQRTTSSTTRARVRTCAQADNEESKRQTGGQWEKTKIALATAARGTRRGARSYVEAAPAQETRLFAGCAGGRAGRTEEPPDATEDEEFSRGRC